MPKAVASMGMRKVGTPPVAVELVICAPPGPAPKPLRISLLMVVRLELPMMRSWLVISRVLEN
jgi:hypothetical protein